jgi:prepilin-type N-terminal cleavage/methylation domain-containing protein
MKERGFTLVETLVALSLVGAVLLPASLWLYSSRTSRDAMGRFRAVQMLEMEMNRAFVLRLKEPFSREQPGPGYLRLEIRPIREGAETRLVGKARDRQGRILAELQAGYFAGRAP